MSKKHHPHQHTLLLLLSLLLFLFFLGLWVTRSFAGTNTALIIRDTLGGLPACLHYEIKGSCFWLSRTGAPITTPYIQHYLPDVVVSVFNKPGDNPWLEMDVTLDQAGRLAQSSIVDLMTGLPVGGGQHSFQHPFEQQVFFKEIDVVGNPALPLLPTTPFLLPSAAIPFTPYFQSLLDSALWRGFPPLALPEQAYAYGANVLHIVGNGVTVWGGAYPFEGKIIAANEAKAAAVIAQRAGNLLTASQSWGHLVKPLSTHCGTECQAAAIQENDSKTQFQLIYPTLETQCLVFGRSSTYGENVTAPANGAYVWVLWRHYQGCTPCPGCTFISKIVMG